MRKIIREKVEKLRRRGKTYSEINKILKTRISKSTLSCWCRKIPLPPGYQKKIQIYNRLNLDRARKIAWSVNKLKRERYLKKIDDRNKNLVLLLKKRDIAKIALTMLYLGEGSKDLKRGALMFGNSSPFIISLFVSLLRYCYNIDEDKFRCTLQCRADQDVKKLEKFWSRVTRIPLRRFYKARIDPRTVGKPSRKTEYKGVCRIDYFSAEILIELVHIPKLIHKGP